MLPYRSPLNPIFYPMVSVVHSTLPSHLCLHPLLCTATLLLHGLCSIHRVAPIVPEM